MITESEFIRQNQEDWKNFEKSLEDPSIQTEQLSRQFSKVSADLAFAQTHYPRRGIRRYLNQLLGEVFTRMMVKPKVNFRKTIAVFYTDTVAGVIVKHRYTFVLSLVLFLLSILVGWYSTLVNENFPVTILGAEYMALTEANIEANDPMAIYKSSPSSTMFLAITFNNIKVAFLAYVMGVFAMIGTFYVLIKNGIMLGTFQTFFYTKGLLLTSFLTIWIHGTIEISSIIIAGSAGIILGKSIVHPGTFTRAQSIKFGALESFIIVMSTVPLFIIAGFLEGFVTRYTGLPMIVKIGIIGFSWIFILLLYVFLPYQYVQSGKKHTAQPVFVAHEAKTEKEGDDEFVLVQALKGFRLGFETILYYILIPGICFLIPLILYEVSQDRYTYGLKDGSSIFADMSFVFYFGLFIVVFLLVSVLHARGESGVFSIQGWYKSIVRFFPVYVISALLLCYPILFSESWTLILVMAAVPFLMGFVFLYSTRTSKDIYDVIVKGVQFTYQHWPKMMLYTIMAILFFLMLDLFTSMIRWLFLDDLILWHNIFENAVQNTVFLELLMRIIFYLIYLVLLYFLMHEVYIKTRNRKYSEDLKPEVERFIQKHQKSH